MSFKLSAQFPVVTIDADPDKYHALGAGPKRGEKEFVMSRSQLKDFAACPARWLDLPAEEETKATEWGGLIDCLVTSPTQFAVKYAIRPDVYPCEPSKKDPRSEKPWNGNSTWCQDWKAEQEANGLAVISFELQTEATKAVQRLGKYDDIRKHLEASRRQVQICVDWHDEATGIIVPFKCLIDLLPGAESDFGNAIGDLKTTASAELKEWTRSVNKFGYAYQAAVYLDALNAAAGEKRKQFFHVISESSAPYEPTIRYLSEDWIVMMKQHYRNDLAFYCHCLSTGRWPGLDRAIVEQEAWMIA